MRRFILAVVLFGVVPSFWAAERVSFYGLSTQNCQHAVQIVLPIVQRMPQLNEKVIVFCSDTEFADLLNKLQLDPRTSAMTVKDAEGGITICIRGGAILGETPWNPGYTPEHIIAHEYGHLVTRSSSDQVAEVWALRNIAPN